MPDIRITQPAIQTEVPVRESQPQAGAAPAEISAMRKFLLSRSNSALTDRLFHWLMVLCALSIFAIVGLIAWRLVVSSQLTWDDSASASSTRPMSTRTPATRSTGIR